MATDAVLSGRELAGRAGIVYEDARTRVMRVVVAGRSVIAKELLGPDADRRLRHELAMLARLRAVAGVAQLVGEAPRYPRSVVVADAGGESLAGVAKPLAVSDLVGLAARLARAVAGMHRRGVMHRDICPANVVVGRDGVPCLVGFGVATSVAEIRPEFTHHGEITGQMAYLAPEQTGRTGRADRPGGGRAGRPVRVGRDVVRAGHGRAAVRDRGSAAAYPRSPGPGPGAAGRGEPGRAGTVVRDHHAPAGEGAGQPVPDRGRPGL